MSIELAQDRQRDLQADAQRARLAREARNARRRQRRNPAMTVAPTRVVILSTEAEDLATVLAEAGPEAVEPQLRRFVRDARRQGASQELMQIVADTAEPPVVRQRAFGSILQQLGHSEQQSGECLDDGPEVA